MIIRSEMFEGYVDQIYIYMYIYKEREKEGENEYVYLPCFIK